MSIVAMALNKCTEFRNPTVSEGEAPIPAAGWKLAVAELGYIACIPFAVVSTALLVIATLFAGILSLVTCNSCFLEWSINQLMLSGASVALACIFAGTQLCWSNTPMKPIPLTFRRPPAMPLSEITPPELSDL